MVPSLDGVADVVVIADLVACRGCRGESSRLRSDRGLAPWVRGRSELLPVTSPLLLLPMGRERRSGPCWEQPSSGTIRRERHGVGTLSS
jgi:hypothetical protein